MAYDVFLSYSSKDKATADAVCHALEAVRIRVWMAPRDIAPGDDWAHAIVQAINNARMMVLVFSGHANQSPQIAREIGRAVDKGLTILPVRIENVAPRGALEYYLSAQHWLDAFPEPSEAHFERLAKSVRRILESGFPGPQSAQPSAAKPPDAAKALCANILGAGKPGLQRFTRPKGKARLVAFVTGAVVVALASAAFLARKPIREPELVEIPAGSFMMGMDANNPGRLEKIPDALDVGKYPVTFAEWDACASTGACRGYRPDDNGWGRGNRPVVNVSWYDAQNYVEWLSLRTGESYRLPTDVEREYFTRAGSTTAYWWGNTIDSRQANFSSKDYAKTDAPDRTMPVDSYAPNPWGLFQVHGNIWEWIEDCRSMEEQICTMRALRGGGWDMDGDKLKSSNGGQNTPTLRSSTVGFRVVRAHIRRDTIGARLVHWLGADGGKTR
jgi:formylglycine-generating enzyme required for sulfatase activity